MGGPSSLPLTEQEEELIQPSAKAKPEKVSFPKAPKLDMGMIARVSVMGFFNTIAIATSHEHWLKEHEEVEDVVGPLTVWLNQLPAKRIKQIENNAAPILAIGSFLNILVPDIAEEVKIRRESARANQGAAQGKPQSRAANRPPGSSAGMDSGAVNGSGAGELHVSIPNDFARSAINDSFDV